MNPTLQEIVNDTYNIHFPLETLRKGDLVRVCYQHTFPKFYEPALGDYCYIVGYVVFSSSDAISLSNVNPSYSSSRIPFFFEKKIHIPKKRIAELVKITF